MIAAAGALSVATAASATAVAWSQGAPGHADGLAETTHETLTRVALTREPAAAPRLTVTDQITDQITGPIVQTASEQGNATWVQRAYLVRLTAARDAIAQRKAAASAAANTMAVKSTLGSPQQVARALLGSFGWSAASQFSCLDPLWAHESGWSVSAYNAGSGAFGIPQALPGSRMASAGPDWQTSAATQIKWGLRYIKGTYGSPCGAWAHEEATGWY